MAEGKWETNLKSFLQNINTQRAEIGDLIQMVAIIVRPQRKFSPENEIIVSAEFIGVRPIVN
jgi:hypothetical protein